MVLRGGVRQFQKQSLLFIASFFVLITGISAAHVAHANAADTQPTSPELGFSKSSIYRSQIDTLRYYSSSSDADPTFYVVNSETDEGSRVASEDVTPGDVTSYKVWKILDEPDAGVKLLAYEGSRGGSSDVVASVSLRTDPVLSLEEYTTKRGGSTLAVRGTIDQKPLKGLSVRAELFSTDAERKRIAETTVTVSEDQKLSAQLPLPSDLVGSYVVVLTAVYAGEEIDREEKLVELNTTRPVVSVAAASRDVTAGEQITISGTVATPAAALESVVVSYDDRQENVSVAADGSFVFTIPGGLEQGAYTFSITARDILGNTNESSPASTTIDVQRAIVRGNVAPIDEVELVPITRLSSEFSIPVAPSLVSSNKMRQAFGAPSAQTTGDVLGSEEQNLEGVIDLSTEEPVSDTPLEPTSNGWSLFGVSWYWWAVGSMTIWASIASTRWWMQRA